MEENPTPRKTKRVPLQAHIDFRRAGDHAYLVNILDISPEGCRIDLPERVKLDEVIWITLPGLESLQGRVCWVNEWTAGVEFVRPLYPAVFDMIAGRMQGGS